MILAEKRGLLTPENRAAARAAIEAASQSSPVDSRWARARPGPERKVSAHPRLPQ